MDAAASEQNRPISTWICMVHWRKVFLAATNHLYIIDLGSTNGTFHNGIPLGPGVARALKHNDTITLGRFSFTLKLIDGPTMHKGASDKLATTPGVGEVDKTKPLEPLDPSEIKEKKARLAPPTFDPTSPETTKLPEDEETKPQPPLSANAVKPSPAKAKSPIPDARSLIVGSAPTDLQVSPAPEAKPSKPEEKKPDMKTEAPTSGLVSPKEVTKPLDPETKPMIAKPPTSEAKPAVIEDKSPEKENEAAKTEAKPSTSKDMSDKKEQKPSIDQEAKEAKHD